MNYREQLDWIIGEVQARVDCLRIDGLPKEREPLLRVAGSLVVGFLEAAEALSQLLKADRFRGVAGLHRAIWEHERELEYLAKSTTPERDAIKAIANATIELLETIEKIDDPPPEMKTRNVEELAKLESSHPEIISEVRGQRSKKQKHWSGKSRTEVYSGTDASRLVYKLLSWEAHPEMGPIRDLAVEVEGESARLVITGSGDDEELLERIAWSAGGMLFHGWNAFANMFGLAFLKLPGN